MIALAWDEETATSDMVRTRAGLAREAGLRTAVIASLFTDRRARDDDVLPEPAPGRHPNRRGWWGDAPLEGDRARPMGSHLWLLRRALATDDTRDRAVRYCEDALRWMTQDGIADSVEVAAAWQGERGDHLAVVVRLRRGGAETRFALRWAREGV